MNDIIFRTILLKGEAGNNIQNIEKTATEGLEDTYTLTLTDGTTTTFKVTNGRSIVSFELVSASGGVNVFKITYNDGKTENITLTYPNDRVTPQMYGAIADGETDCTDALQACFNTQKSVYIPKGVYLISDTLHVYMDSGSVELDKDAILKYVGEAGKSVVYFGAYRNVYNDRYMSWKGGTIDCNNISNSVGLQIERHALGSTISDLVIINVGDNDSYGIDIEHNDDNPSSIQLNLNNIRITGKDSARDNTGIYCNAYDLYSTNIYVYECKRGINMRKSEWHIDFYHYWWHRENNAVCTKAIYEESYALTVIGNMEIDNLYMDMPHRGAIVGGGMLHIGKAHFITPRDEYIDDVTTYIAFDISQYSKVAIHSMTYDNSRSTANIFSVSKTVGAGAKFRQAINCGIKRQIKTLTEVRDIAFDNTINSGYELLSNYGTTEIGEYIIGYIGCIGGTLSINIGNVNNERYHLDITATNLGASIRSFQKINTNIDVEFGLGNTSETINGILYVPLVMKLNKATTGAYSVKADGQCVFCTVTGASMKPYSGTVTYIPYIRNNVANLTRQTITFTTDVSIGTNRVSINIPTLDYYTPTSLYSGYTSDDANVRIGYLNPANGEIELISETAITGLTVHLDIWYTTRNGLSRD